VSGQPHALATVPPGIEPTILIAQEAGWSPEPCWMWWQREKIPARNQQGQGIFSVHHCVQTDFCHLINPSEINVAKLMLMFYPTRQSAGK
jgi:hypothetical protein